jgi:hypothetical protein
MNLMFRNVMENSSQIEPDNWKNRGLLERLHQTVGWLFEPLL